jgi:hypothetical protein
MRIYAWLVGGLLLLTATPARAADPTCVQPEVRAFLEDVRPALGDDKDASFLMPEAFFAPAEIDGTRIQWMGTGWVGPRSGALFVLNCEGHPLAVLNLGQVLHANYGPKLPGIGPTLVVIYIYASGMGQNGTWAQLVTFQNGSIIPLWDHEVETDVDAPGLDEYHDLYTWKFSDSGEEIRVRGTRRVGDTPNRKHGWKRHTTHAFPNETWVWNPEAKRYAKQNAKSARRGRQEN